MDGRRTGESEQAHIARLNDEIERLRRDVKEANARAYVMAQEVALWQDRATTRATRSQ